MEKDKEISSLKKLAHCNKQDIQSSATANVQPVVTSKKNSLFLELVNMTCDFNKVKKEKDNAKYDADKVKREQLGMTKTIEDLRSTRQAQKEEQLAAEHHVNDLKVKQLNMAKSIEELKRMLGEQREEFESCKQENETLHDLKDELLKDRSAFQQKFIALKTLLIDARRK